MQVYIFHYQNIEMVQYTEKKLFEHWSIIDFKYVICGQQSSNSEPITFFWYLNDVGGFLIISDSTTMF